jgi:pyruvate/2-oxoglutarate dehydrogenase complex dihydrolipoamide dehydrogenase (E3) component
MPDIFAIGDCAQAKDFVIGKNIPIMLASVAATEARIVANNLYQIELIRENKGTLGVFSTFIDGLALGVAGLTENRAKEEGIDYLIGEAEAPNHHPASLPGTGKIKVKLIFSKSSENLLLGGEIMGPESAGEMLNILAMAIQQRTSVFDFNAWQIATHPLLTSAPTVYPLIGAAQNAILKIKK